MTMNGTIMMLTLFVPCWDTSKMFFGFLTPADMVILKGLLFSSSVGPHRLSYFALYPTCY